METPKQRFEGQDAYWETELDALIVRFNARPVNDIVRLAFRQQLRQLAARSGHMGGMPAMKRALERRGVVLS